MIAENQFAWRECLGLNLNRTHESKVERVYENGFDAIIDDRVVFFTSNPERLNPLAFCLNPGVLQLCREDEKIFLDSTRLCIGAQILRPVKPFADEPFPGEIFPETLRLNLQVLFSNIKLFGRSSVVKDLIIGCNTQKNLLTGAESHLLEFPPDLERLKSLVGSGDGLTPAFDDLLSGMLLADRRSKNSCIEIPDDFWSFVGLRTTRQAQQQLQFAAEGHMNLLSENLTDELLGKKISSAKIVKALNQGQSSGTDILCGIWLYLSRAFASAIACCSEYT